MVEIVRLSEISAQATAALATLDATALARLAARLDEAVAGRLGIEPETAETVSTSQRVFQGVLDATGQSIHMLARLNNRKGIDEWAR